MNTPWGKADRIEELEPGICDVSTPSHGGTRITWSYAKKNLSVSAVEAALKYDDCLWFEEDCDWAIPAWELPHLWSKMFANAGEEFDTPEKQRAYILGIVVFRCTVYALKQGLAKLGDSFSCPNYSFDHRVKPQKLACLTGGKGMIWHCRECNYPVYTISPDFVGKTDSNSPGVSHLEIVDSRENAPV